MAKEKKSFFERITGTVRMDDSQDDSKEEKENSKELAGWKEDDEKEGELTVDVYQTADMIIIKAMIAGVRPEDLDISITRDLITIKGKREEEKTARDDDYFMRELTRLQLPWIPSEGNFITFDTQRDALKVYEALLRKGIILRPILNYGFKFHLRMSVGRMEENQAAIQALEEVLADIPRGSK